MSAPKLVVRETRQPLTGRGDAVTVKHGRTPDGRRAVSVTVSGYKSTTVRYVAGQHGPAALDALADALHTAALWLDFDGTES